MGHENFVNAVKAFYVLAIVFQFLPSGAFAADNGPIICIVQSSSNVFCATKRQISYYNRIPEVRSSNWRDMFGLLDGRQSNLNKLIKNLAANFNIPKDNSVLYGCPDGQWFGRDVTEDVSGNSLSTLGSTDKPILLRDNNILQLQKQCDISVTQSIENSNASNFGPRGYTDLVEKTVSEMDSFTDEQCRTGADERVAGLLDFVPGLGKIKDVTWGILDNMAKAQQAKEDFSRGANDRRNGEVPQKKTSDWFGVLTPYGQGYRTQEKICNADNGIECEPIETEDPPDPQPEPSPEPAPSPEPEPEPNVSSDCYEIAGCTSCQSRKEFWDFFKSQCDAVDWKSYECKSFVNAYNNCPDTATMYPTPDGDYECRAKMTQEELVSLFRIKQCEDQGKVAEYRQGFQCKTTLPFDNINSMEILKQRACLYSISESCFDSPIEIFEPAVPNIKFH